MSSYAVARTRTFGIIGHTLCTESVAASSCPRSSVFRIGGVSAGTQRDGTGPLKQMTASPLSNTMAMVSSFRGEKLFIQFIVYLIDSVLDVLHHLTCDDRNDCL